LVVLLCGGCFVLRVVVLFCGFLFCFAGCCFVLRGCAMVGGQVVERAVAVKEEDIRGQVG
jgi:hypothetical protein